MTRSLNTRRTQHTLYLLRREFGGPVTVYRLMNSESDPRTGVKTKHVDVYDVSRAVILPGNWGLKERRGISLISANKQLVQGGHYESGLQAFIVDSRDIPFEPTSDDWLVHNDRRYNFASIGRYEDNSSWLIGAQALPGRAAEQIFLVKSETLISLTQGADDAD